MRLDRREGSAGGLLFHQSNSWSYVCDDAFTNTEATVACKSLMYGYQYGVAIKGSAYLPMRDHTLDISMVKCTGNETDLKYCQVKEGVCASGHYVSVACNETPFNTSGMMIFYGG